MGTTGRRPVYRRYARLLGANLRKRRGETSLREFARRVGLSKSELHRMEQGEQNVSLSMLELLSRRLKCGIGELFTDYQNDAPDDHC